MHSSLCNLSLFEVPTFEGTYGSLTSLWVSYVYSRTLAKCEKICVLQELADQINLTISNSHNTGATYPLIY